MKQKYYEVTWYGQEAAVLNEESIKQITSCMQTAGQDLDIKLTLKEASSNQMTFEVITEETANLGKTLRALQKKVSKEGVTFLSQAFKNVKGPRVVSYPNGRAKTDGRLKSLIKDIRDVGYYDLHEFFSGDLAVFKMYLEERKLGVIDLGERIYLVDIENIKHKINLNCFECTKKHQYGCCCGSPCDMSRRNREHFETCEAAIGEEVKVLNPESYKIIQQTGGFVFLDGTINECNGHCALLVHHEGSYKCMAHKYALDQKMPIYELCPLSCLMYPLELMTLFTDKQKRIMLLTSVVEEEFANEYGRWGSYASLEVELRCINEKAADEVFKKEDYKPIYEVNRGLLIHELGLEVYEGVRKLCEKNAGQ